MYRIRNTIVGVHLVTRFNIIMSRRAPLEFNQTSALILRDQSVKDKPPCT